MSDNKHIPVELDELLAAEFNYIAQTAIQAFEDRARVSSFYMIAVGSLIAALLSAQLFDANKFTPELKLMFSGIFLLLTLLGTSTVVQLAQLRTAWYESMMAMNQIKDFAMHQSPELIKAFRWKTSTLPVKYKKGNVSYYQALEVAIIGGLMFSATGFFLQYAYQPIGPITWISSTTMGALAIFIQMKIYKRLLT